MSHVRPRRRSELEEMPPEGARHPGGSPAEDRLGALESTVAELARFRETLSWRVKVGAGVIVAILGIAGIDAFLTNVLQASLKRYLGVPTDDQLKTLVWNEMSDQVATSYSGAFSLGTLEQAQDAATRRYATLPFFAPSNLAGVILCYTVNHSGSAEPTGIEVRLDDSAAVLTIRPPPEDETGRRRQHGCVDELEKTFGLATGATGTLEHSVSFALQKKNAASDRKDITVLLNVVGRLQARKAAPQ